MMGKKITKLLSKLEVDSYDMITLVSALKDAILHEDDYERILKNIVDVKDDVLKTVQCLKKEL